MLQSMAFVALLLSRYEYVGSNIDLSPTASAHVYVDLGAAFALFLGVVALMSLLEKPPSPAQEAPPSGLGAAAHDFQMSLAERFTAWELSPAQKEVAALLVKGLSMAEIARLRDTSEGTVKAQVNAIYRKAGVSGRPQLVGIFLEELLEDLPLPKGDK